MYALRWPKSNTRNFNALDKQEREISKSPPPIIQLGGGVIALVSPPAGGVIVYEVLNPVEILSLAAISIKSMVPQLETEFATATLEEVF
jgi:hypothetical protein